MKTKEELTQLKTEYEKLNQKLKELTEDELNMVTGGASGPGVYGMTDPDTGGYPNQDPSIVHRKSFG